MMLKEMLRIFVAGDSNTRLYRDFAIIEKDQSVSISYYMDEQSSKRRKYDDDERISKYFNQQNRLSRDFFNVPCEDLAKNLLGTVLVRQLSDGTILKGKIVETECYPGSQDRASFSFNGRRTARNEPMFMEPGTIFVYQTYGMYYCLNISSQGEGAAVLLRAVEPLIGLERMSENRSTYHVKRKKKQNDKATVARHKDTCYKPYELCNGPSKLCISFDIDIENCNKRNLIDFSNLWIEERIDPVTNDDIVYSSRIGIASAGVEWASKLFRYYLLDNKSVSVRDKKQEAVIRK